jgi:hypothetical protein
MTISEDGSLVRNSMFSGLSTRHSSVPNTPRGEQGVTYFRSRWTMSWSCRYLTPDSTDLKEETEDSWLRGDVYGGVG